MAKPTAEAPDPAPASALELIGAGAPDSVRTDPDAARQALEAVRQDGDQEQRAPGAEEEAGQRARADRRRRGAKPRARSGGHKPTKEELEEELRELRANIAAAHPEAVATLQSQAEKLAPVVAATLETVFGMVARARGEHWKLPEQESAQLAGPWAECLAPHLGKAGEYAPWIMALMITWRSVERRGEQDSRGRALPAAA